MVPRDLVGCPYLGIQELRVRELELVDPPALTEHEHDPGGRGLGLLLVELREVDLELLARQVNVLRCEALLLRDRGPKLKAIRDRGLCDLVPGDEIRVDIGIVLLPLEIE